MDNQSLSHTKWKCQFHIVLIPKYRKKVMYGKVKKDVQEIIKTLCEYKKRGCFLYEDIPEVIAIMKVVDKIVENAPYVEPMHNNA